MNERTHGGPGAEGVGAVAGDGDISGRPVAYFRGAGGVLDRRHAARVVVAFSFVVLVGLTAVLTVEAVERSSRVSALRRHGVPVVVTVTGCRGMASGTGITVSGYRCAGVFPLGAHRYAEVIGGNTDLYAVGRTIRAIADPGDPANVSTVRAVETARSWWEEFLIPAIPLALLIVAVFSLRWRALSTRRQN
jgi:hypothetical protein